MSTAGTKTDLTDLGRRDTIKFVAVFFLCFGAFSFFVVSGPFEGVLNALIKLNALLVFLLFDTFIEGTMLDGAIINLPGYWLEINLECLAVQFISIFAAAVLASPGHGPGYKLKGLLAGVSVLFAVNVFRIVTLGLVGLWNSSLFDFVHAYLWQGLYALIIFLCWHFWYTRQWLGGGVVRFALVGVGVAGLGLLLIREFMLPYIGVIAGVSDLLHPLGVGIDADGGGVSYSSAGGMVYFPMAEDVYDLLIFLVLFFSTLAYRRRAGLVDLWWFGAGLLAMALMHVLLVISGGFIVSSELAGSQLQNVMWLMRGASLVTPIALWFVWLKFTRTAGGKFLLASSG